MGQAAKPTLKNEEMSSLSSFSLLEHQQQEVSGTKGVLTQQTTMVPFSETFSQSSACPSYFKGTHNPADLVLGFLAEATPTAPALP